MVVPMMRIGIMGMRMCQWLMPMPMAMRTGDGLGMLVLMMLVVNVFVIMLQRFMGMRMFMVLGEMQPYTRAH